MRFAHREILLAEVDRHVEADGRQALGQAQVVGPGGDLLTLLARDAVDVRQDVLHRAPLLHQLAGALLADARHAGNVVRGIAPQRQDVAHELRIVDAVTFADRRAVDNLDAPSRALLPVDAAMVAHQLPVVLVGGYHVDVVSRLGALFRKGADHVVGLVSLDFEDRNAHRLEDPLHVGNRQQDVLGRLRTVGFVGGEDLAAETAPLGIEGHAQQVGTLALEHVAQELHEAEDHRGVHPRAVAHRAAEECVVVFEDQRVGVDKEEFFHTFGRLKCV